MYVQNRVCTIYVIVPHAPESRAKPHGLGMRYSLPFQHKAGRNANEDKTGLNYT